MRYFIEISYRGTHYCGWQVQENKPSVQGELNRALSTLFNHEIFITGAGRTDSGVHAFQSFAHFDSEMAEPENFLNRTNKMLPKDIVIHRIMKMEEDSHARFDAVSRSYKYFVHFEKDAFLFDRSFFFPYLPLDMNKMEAASRLLTQFEDYAPLSRYNKDLKTTLCQVYESRWQTIDNGKGLVFYISANRFLHGMVRRIVGALLMIGKGKLSIEEFQDAMESRKSLKLNISVPPNGLFLNSVTYPYL